jgi:signal transduction histidine kinase
VRRVLLLPILVIAALAAAALAYVARTSLGATQRINRELADVRAANALAQRKAQLSADLAREVMEYRLRPARGLAAEIDRLEAAVDAVDGALAAQPLPPRGRLLLERVDATDAVRRAVRRELLAAVDAGDREAIGRGATRWHSTVTQATASISDFAIYNLRRLERTAGDLERVRSRVVALLVVVLTSSAILVLGSWLYLERWLIGPVRAMTAAARQIGEERAAVQVPGAERSDELGVLAATMTRMAGDLVRANDELARALELRDEFLSVASHELKTPLTSLKLHLQNGQRRWLDATSEPIPPWLLSALRQMNRLQTLVSELLDLARLRSGTFELYREHVDVSELVRGTADRLRHVLARRGNPLDIDVRPGVEGSVDPGRLEQVVTNLMMNAAQHAPGAPVRVRVDERPGRVVVAVEDGGAGIPDDARERVFAPYERAQRVKPSAGLGLGLYIVKRIVDAHGGAIEVGRSELGGAVFRIDLPSGAAAGALRQVE